MLNTISGFADIGSQADQRQFKAAVWGFAAELETNRKPLQMMPAHSRARFSYKQGQALVVQSLVSRKTHRKKPMVHGKLGTNARTEEAITGTKGGVIKCRTAKRLPESQ